MTLTALNAQKEPAEVAVPYDPQRIAVLDMATLDIHHAANLMKTVRRLCDELGKTVILVLHEIN